MSDTPLCEVTVHVTAPPETVWDLVADLPRMGEWSPETTRVEWLSGATGPALGAKFKGVNQDRSRKWSTTGCIVQAERGKIVSWDVTSVGSSISRWTYRMTPTDDGGCDVTEQMFDHRNGFIKFMGGIVSGVKDRGAHNANTMQTTLDRLKAAAEAPVT